MSDTAPSPLEEEVAHRLTVLPVVCRQLRETSASIEQSVVAVCGSFDGMAGRARDVVARTVAVIGSGDGAPDAALDGMVAAVRSTLQALLERSEEASRFATRVSMRMQEVQRATEQVARRVGTLETIAQQTRMLALNASIEAARAGQFGRGFAVVASEIRTLAQRSSDTAEAVIDLVSRLQADMSASSNELAGSAALDHSEAARRKDEAEHALAVLSGANEELRASAREAVRGNEELARDISRAVIALQFQDAVSQRLGHVVDAIEEMRTALAPHVSHVATDGDCAGALERAYTMESERRVHAEVRGAGHASDAPAGSVELF